MKDEGEPAAGLDALLEDFVARVRRGEEPDVEAYVRAHPSLADDIREVFPVLAVMEGVKPGARAPDAPLPASIAGYRVVREIGTGSMGRVLEAVDGRGGRVAIKCAHPRLARRAGYVERFRREAEAGLRVRHPGVVRTLGSGALDDHAGPIPYLVLEYVDGQSLRSLLAEMGTLPERLVRFVGARVAEALGAIHAVGIVHGDLKPENVVIRPDETVVVVDLGVSRLSEGADPSDEGFAGSLLYAAPEQLAGVAIAPAADLYSLGVVLHEMATGRHPGQPPAPGSPRPSPFLAALVTTLLSRERFPSAAALATTLDEGERSAWWRARATTAPVPRPPRDPIGFLGRAAERRLLDQAFESVVDGAGRVVVVEGEEGIGKTRLLEEWVAELRSRPGDHRVVVASADDGRDAVASALGGILAGEPGAADLEDRLGRILGDRPDWVSGLAARIRGEAGPSLSPEAFRTACVDVVRASAGAAPLVVVVEDLDHAPPGSREAFWDVARAIEGARVLWATSARTPAPPERETPGAGLGHVVRVALEGLEDAHAHALLLDVFRSEGSGPPGDLDECIRWAEGSPRLLLDHAHDVLRRRRAGDPSAGAAPSFGGDVRARLRRMDARDRDVLEATACDDPEPDAARIARALGRGPLDVARSLARLDRVHGFLRRAGATYAFRRRRLRSAVYEGLSDDRRTALHDAFADAVAGSLGSAPPADRDATAVSLCEHASRGTRFAVAGPWLDRALSALLDATELRRAEAIVTRALADPTALAGAERSRALVTLSHCLLSRGDYPGARRTLDEALGAATAGGDPAERSEVCRRIGLVCVHVADPETAVPWFRDALESARKAGRAVLAARAQVQLASALNQVGRVGEAVPEALAAVDAVRAADSPLGESDVDRLAGVVLLHANRLAEARSLFERASEIARATGNRISQAHAHEALGRLAFRDGRFGDASRHGATALGLYRDVGQRNHEPPLLANAALCLFEIGRMADAEARAREALAMARGPGLERGRVSATTLLARVWAAHGRLGEALDALRGARADAGRFSDLAARLAPVAALGETFSALGAFEDAGASVAEIESVAAGRPDGGRSVSVPVRARIAEDRDDVQEAAALQRARRGERPEGQAPGGWDVALGRTCLRAGRADEARDALRRALAWGQRQESPRVATLARAHLATLPDGDVLAARLALERHVDALAVRERVEAFEALWRATGEPRDLEAARRWLDFLVERAPADHRTSMVERVALHRRVRLGLREPR